MSAYFKLLRIKDWAKNLFMFLPSFFAGEIFNLTKIELLILGFLSFSFFASCIYIINDYNDIEDDKKHPEKSKRPFPSGAIKKTMALPLCFLLLVAGSILGYFADPSLKFLFITGIYFTLNFAYSFGLKNIAVLDVLILSSGFVLRVKGGAAITDIPASHWLVIMTFLLALFMAVAKRRDDLLLKQSTGREMRKSINGYSVEFLNTMSGLLGAIIIVDYFMYTIDTETLNRLGTTRLYYTGLFVIAGIMRYLQITIVDQKSGSPTKILYKDRFIQVTLLLWALAFYFVIYIKDMHFFKKI
ncbi:MAG: decaprenyl-phosphate phosphoribosyltransferase [Bacteroidota bacterium]